MSHDSRRRITLERTYRAPVDKLWELWTTPAGIQAWWGPQGFRVDVRELDLRPGGKLHYVMTATDPATIAYMEQHGIPLSNEARATYTDVSAPRHFGYDSLVDFVPGHAPYTITNTVELQATAQGTRVVLGFDAMHDEDWTQRLVAGRTSQLDKLGQLLA